MAAGTPLPAPSGTERWQRSVARERILQELHAIALEGTLRSNADIPTPEQFDAWAKDLRRGRLSIPGGMVRWIELLRRRHHPEARALALRVNALVLELIDLELPADAVVVATNAPGSASANWQPITAAAPADPSQVDGRVDGREQVRQVLAVSA